MLLQTGWFPKSYVKLTGGGGGGVANNTVAKVDSPIPSTVMESSDSARASPAMGTSMQTGR